MINLGDVDEVWILCLRDCMDSGFWWKCEMMFSKWVKEGGRGWNL